MTGEQKGSAAHKRVGFTLIELLIVIAIIAILALIALPNFLEAQVRAKAATAKANIRSIAVAFEAYFVDYNTYPYRYQGGVGSGIERQWQNFAGGVGAYTAGLYGPIQYLTNERIVDDPFRDDPMKQPNIEMVNFLNAKQCAVLYTGDWNGTDRDRLLAPAPVRLNGSDAPVRFAKWAMFSRGPDRKWDDPRTDNPDKTSDVTECIKNNNQWNWVVMTGQSSLYDTTNGTMSRGNIWRTDGWND